MGGSRAYAYSKFFKSDGVYLPATKATNVIGTME
jgi:hypothetical protein